MVASGEADLGIASLSNVPKNIDYKVFAQFIDNFFERKGLNYSIAMEVTGREAVKTYVGMDLGISIINEYYLTAEDRKKLFVKDVSNYFGTAERGILTQKNRFLSSHVKEFINKIRPCLSS